MTSQIINYSRIVKVLYTHFTKTRHHNITFIIVVQTVKFIPKKVKRMLSDVVIYGRLSEEDFLGLMKELPIDWNIDKLYQEYKDKTKAEHSKMIIDLSVPSYTFE